MFIPSLPKTKLDDPFRNSRVRQLIAFILIYFNELIARSSDKNTEADLELNHNWMSVLVLQSQELVKCLEERFSPKKSGSVASEVPVEEKPFTELEIRQHTLSVTRKIVQTSIKELRVMKLAAEKLVVKIQERGSDAWGDRRLNDVATVRLNIKAESSLRRSEVKDIVGNHEYFNPQKNNTNTEAQFTFRDLPTEEWMEDKNVHELRLADATVVYTVNDEEAEHSCVIESNSPIVEITGQPGTRLKLIVQSRIKELRISGCKSVELYGETIEYFEYTGSMNQDSEVVVNNSCDAAKIIIASRVIFENGCNTLSADRVDELRAKILTKLECVDSKLLVSYQGLSHNISQSTFHSCTGTIRVYNHPLYYALNSSTIKDKLKVLI